MLTYTARAQLLSSVTVVAICLAGPVAGQDTAPQNTSGQDIGVDLDTIVVGAGTPKVAIDTPQAVTVITQSDLDQEQPRTTADIFRDVPGVSMAGASERPIGQSFNIRGIGNTEQTASQNRIIVTVDGASKFFEQYRTGSFFGDPELYRRVEVLRGPASSTLYGTGAIGGVVAFTTKDASDFLAPGDTGVLRTKLAYGSNGNDRTATVTWAQRVNDQAELLASFSVGKAGTMEDGNGKDIPSTDFDRWSGLVKSTVHFGDNNDKSVTIALSRSNTRIDNAAVSQTDASSVLYSIGGRDVTSYDVFGTSHLNAVDDTLTLGYRDKAAYNPLIDLNVQLSYSKTKTVRDDFELASYCSPGSYQVLCDNTARYETLALKAENTAEMSVGAWDNTFTVGAQASKLKRTATSSLGALAFHPGGTEDMYSLYAQGELVYNDRLTITPGARVDRTSISPDGAARDMGGADENNTAVSPKIAALYQITDAFGVFGSLAHTERMPTVDELYSSDNMGSAGRTASLDLKKEKANAVEVGMTWQAQNLLQDGDTLAAKLTGFNYNMTDLIASRPRGSANMPYFYNVDSARIWGGEIEANYEAARWFAALAYSKVHSKDKSTGEVLTDTPAETVALTLGAKFPDQGLRLSWRLRAADAIETRSAATSAPGFGVQDIYASWQPQGDLLSGIQVDLGIENVFDRAYRENLSLDNSAGRNIKLAVSKSFHW